MEQFATWTPAGDSDAYAVPNEFFSGDAVFEKIVDYSTKVPSIITGPYFMKQETQSLLRQQILQMVQI